MEEKTKERLRDGKVWMRLLYMVLFAFAGAIAEMLVVLMAIFQFLSVLITGRANEPLLAFGSNLSAYIYQILEFVTFNDETLPFPFSAWPNEEAGGERWTRDDDDDDGDDEDDAPSGPVDAEFETVEEPPRDRAETPTDESPNNPDVPTNQDDSDRPLR